MLPGFGKENLFSSQCGFLLKLVHGCLSTLINHRWRRCHDGKVVPQKQNLCEEATSLQKGRATETKSSWAGNFATGRLWKDKQGIYTISWEAKQWMIISHYKIAGGDKQKVAADVNKKRTFCGHWQKCAVGGCIDDKRKGNWFITDWVGERYRRTSMRKQSNKRTLGLWKYQSTPVAISLSMKEFLW